MNNNYLLDSLNQAQTQAVCAPLESQLVLAGAGSGKTTVLIHRIAWLIENYNIPSHTILAVTFTNKAANEMHQRINKLLGDKSRDIWVGTFHGIAHKILRRHSYSANLKENFQIIDTDDQIRIIKNIIREMNLDDQKYIPKKVLAFISSKKDSGLRPSHIDPGYRYDIKVKLEIYRRYNNFCQQNSVVDFSELLLRLHELFLKNEKILQQYQQKFRYILVDEFQDTNNLQYAWLRLMACNNNNLMAVGDDDQSIYGWRGACVGNMRSFISDFNHIKPIKLERNYRSSSNILQAANAVIANNNDRFNKQLICELEAGESIKTYIAIDDKDEAKFIAKYAKKIKDSGDKWQDIAILYRSNAQSRILEEIMVQHSIPYRIYGGSRFFDRAEIKNILAYLRIVCVDDDNLALERIINFPPRGIGDKTLEKIKHTAGDTKSLWSSLITMSEDNSLGIISNKLGIFKNLILEFKQQLEKQNFYCLVKNIIVTTGIIDFYKKDGTSGITRIENLKEFLNACNQFALHQQEQQITDTKQQIQSFIDHIALDKKNSSSEQQDCLQMMTMHAAKGLEFKHVFISGMEEDLFPSKLSIDEGNIEEERRLCYVAITRAMTNLYLSHCKIRQLYGYEKNNKPSRFINEIPEKLLENVGISTDRSYNIKPKLNFGRKKFSCSRFKIGSKVIHKTFGLGVVIDSEGKGDQEKAKINFKTHGVKSLVVAFANLTPT